MSEIPVQFAERYIKRKQTNAVGKSLLKTLTEPITNSDDSYRRTVESESGHSKTVFPITIFVDKAKRMVRLIDQAQGMSADELEKKFREYGAAKSGAYEGFSTRGIFGQGLSDVLFYHRDGCIKSIKDNKASLCRFYWKKGKQYISVDKVREAKVAKEWGISGEHGTVIEFVLEDTVLHDYENLVQKLRVFYMLRLINNNDRREVKLIYKDKGGTKESLIKYEFPKGEPVDSKKFNFQFESYPPVIVDAQLYKSSFPIPTLGDERENGLLVCDEEGAVYDQTFFGLDDVPGADKFFGRMKLTGARDIILEKINGKHPDEILSDSRDGFNKHHDFYKQLSSAVRDWLVPILTEERRRRTNEGISTSIVEKHRQAFEELNKFYKQLTGEDMNGTIRTKELVRPAGGLQFARNTISVTVGKRYGLQLTVDTKVIKPGTTITLKAKKNLIGFSTAQIVVDESHVDRNGLVSKTILITGSKARTVDTLEAIAGKSRASVVVSIVSEDIVYPEKGIVFSPGYVRVVADKDSTLNLYIDLSLVKTGSKVNFSSTNDTIVLKKTSISVPKRMRSTSKVAKIEVPFRGTQNDESGIIEAGIGEYSAQCSIDIRKYSPTPPTSTTGLFRDWDFDDGLSKNQQATLDTNEGSPTQGFILINSSHPINEYYFGENPQKTEALQSQKAQLYIAELILNESLAKTINKAYQKRIIPEIYGPETDIPRYIAERKLEFGDAIYSRFVEAEPTKSDVRRTTMLDEAKEKNEMDEIQLLENMDGRQRIMVQMYFGLGEQRRHTLEEIAAKSDITRERVRQIINKALAPVLPKDKEEEDVYDEEADTRDYIAEEENRLKSDTERIIEKTVQMYEITRDELSEHTRRANVVIPRQIVMYLLRTDIGLSFPSIGRLFDRDHTTVIHACNKVQEMIGRNAKIRNRVNRIQRFVENTNVN